MPKEHAPPTAQPVLPLDYNFPTDAGPLCAGRALQQSVGRIPKALQHKQAELLGDALNAGVTPSIEFGQPLLFKPRCMECWSCLPTRIDLVENTPSKNLRQLSRKLEAATQISVQDMTIPQQHAEHGYLWMSYVLARGPGHFHGDFQEALALDSYPPQKNHPDSPSLVLSFRNAAGTLVGGMELVPALQVEESIAGRSAQQVVYGARNYYQPEKDRHPSTSPGIAQIALACEWLAAKGYRYLYLGHTRQEGPFAYKTRFKPELRTPQGEWAPYAPNILRRDKRSPA